MKNYTLSLLLTLATFSLYAQTPTIQDCLGAIPICQPVYHEAQAPVGMGNYPDEINPNISCMADERNAIWYTFTVSETGDFGFVLTPNRREDDYDWALYDVTNATCAEIRTNPNLLVSCNASGGGSCNGITGATGASSYRIQGAGCGDPNPNLNFGRTSFNALIPVVAGNTYVLCVSNWTGSQYGYEIDFGLSSGIGILDTTLPEIAEIEGPQQCGDSIVAIVFSENIQCASVDAQNFELTGPGGTYDVRLSSTVCQNGGDYSREFTLITQPAIAALGEFTLTLKSSSNTEVLDLCDNSAVETNYTFIVDQEIEIPVSLGKDTALVCEGNVLELRAEQNFSDATYQWQDGSTEQTFWVAQAGVYTLQLSNSCGSGRDSIEVTYLHELPDIEIGGDTLLCEGEVLSLNVENDFSTYEWQNGSTEAEFIIDTPGDYAVSVSNACGTIVDAITVEYSNSFVLDIGEDQLLCEGEELEMDVTTPGANYLWQDGSTTSTFTTSKAGKYWIRVFNDCFEQSDTLELSYTTPPVAFLGRDTTLCEGEVLFLDAGQPDATYEWSIGHNGSSYQIKERGTYSVTVTNVCGSDSDFVTVEFVPAIKADIGPDTVLCPSQRLLLDASDFNADSYRWQDGSSEPRFVVTEPGPYVVQITNECGTVTQEVNVRECMRCNVYVPNAFSPNNDGENDEFRPYSDCVLENYSLRIFNRWGTEVFASNNPDEVWNGLLSDKTAPSAAYIWTLEYTVVEDSKERTMREAGDVVIVR